CYNDQCRTIVTEWHKLLMLVTIDELWKEHLRELDQLRQSVQNASYEQKDPLVIYKVESFHLFENMLNNLNVKATSALMRGQIYVRQAPPQPAQPAPQSEAAQEQPAAAPKAQPEVQRAMPQQQRTDYSRYQANKEAYPGENAQRQAASQPQGQRPAPQPVKAAPKVGRNDLCPCGSGKKYKSCHGRGL
ncbi:MAG: SEC-C domain-containing protein, partial [Muribaculaceae bacterium]|nr:SEC-C domain-containing protein [Muribaculaceae bacterium]